MQICFFRKLFPALGYDNDPSSPLAWRQEDIVAILL